MTKITIIKKRVAVNNPHDIRTRYIVDGTYYFPTKKKAVNFKKYLQAHK